MTKKDLRFLIGKALTDDKFKERLQSDPQGAAADEGCTITSAQADVLKNMKSGDWDKIESVLFDTMIATSDCIG